MYHRNIDDAILFYLVTLSKHFNKGYCYPSQRKILRYIETDYSITCSLRTLNYHLKKLEYLGFFQRVRRITKNKFGWYSFKTTLYILKKKVYTYLYFIKNKLLSALGFMKHPLRSKNKPSPTQERRFIIDLEPDERYRRFQELHHTVE